MTGGVLASLGELLGGAGEVRGSQHSSYKDGLDTEQWIARHTGFSEPVLPEHWQV